jgi:hypothetical protein
MRRFWVVLSKILSVVFVLALLIPVLTKADVVTEGLVSYWTFDKDDIEGDIVKDIWGENDGTIMGDPETVNGKIGEALSLDGAGDYVEVPDDESLHLWETFTFEMWINQTRTLQEGRLMDKCTAGASEGPHFDQYPGMKLRCCSCPGGCCTSANTVYTLNEWHHAVVTYDKGEVSFYLDGSPDGGGNVGSTPLGGNALPLRIGATASDPATHFFVGMVDEVRVYNRALDEDEVKQNFAAEGLAVNIAEKLASAWGEIKASK